MRTKLEITPAEPTTSIDYFIATPQSYLTTTPSLFFQIVLLPSSHPPSPSKPIHIPPRRLIKLLRRQCTPSFPHQIPQTDHWPRGNDRHPPPTHTLQLHSLPQSVPLSKQSHPTSPPVLAALSRSFPPQLSRGGMAAICGIVVDCRSGFACYGRRGRSNAVAEPASETLLAYWFKNDINKRSNYNNLSPVWYYFRWNIALRSIAIRHTSMSNITLKTTARR